MSGDSIHAIKRKDGSFRYRYLSGISDMYETPPLTEDGLNVYLLSKGAGGGGSFSAVSFVLMCVPEMLERARKQGASDDKRNLDRWDKLPQDYWGWRFRRERTKKAFIADVRKRFRLSLSEMISDQLDNFTYEGQEDYRKRADALKKLIKGCQIF